MDTKKEKALINGKKRGSVYHDDSDIRVQEFVRMLAEESGFTIKDTRVFYIALVRTFLKVLGSERKLHLTSFLTLYYAYQKPKIIYNGIFGRYEEKLSDTKGRIRFKFSRIFRNQVKEFNIDYNEKLKVDPTNLISEDEIE